MTRAAAACLAAGLLLLAVGLEAKPPLSTVDMPPTKAEQAELFLGYQYDADRIIGRSIPAAALYLGLSDRDEISVSAPYLSADGHTGFGDVRLGTKYMINGNDKRDSGISAAFEAKLANASQSAELGSGAVDYQGRLIAQQSWKKMKAYLNYAHTWVGLPTINGAPAARHNTNSISAATETDAPGNVKVLAEMVWTTSAIPDTPYSLSANTGLRYKVGDNLELHAVMGRSLREANTGGPRMLAYAGLKFAFASLPSDH